MKFKYEKPVLAEAIDRLGSVAEQFILAKTNRMIQLGREKEGRMVGAYNYLIKREDDNIDELETVLDGIEDNLEERGIEQINLPAVQRTIEFEQLLTAAAEGATELASAKLEYSKETKESLENKVREANKIKRTIDLFDDALSLVDPGEDKIVDAEDVADHAAGFISSYKEMRPYLEQRLTRLESKDNLEKLQASWYDKINKDVEYKIAEIRSENFDMNARLELMSGGKQQTQEAVGGYLSDGLTTLNSSYVSIMGLRAELDSGKDAETGDALDTDQIAEKETVYNKQLADIGSDLFPWSTGAPEAIQNAKMLQSSFLAASGLIIEGGELTRVPPNYNSLVSYLRVANANYQLAGSAEQVQWRASIEKILGIDIANTALIQQIINMNEASRRIDIEEGEIHLDRFAGDIHSSGTGGNEEQDDELKEMMKLFLSGQVGKTE